MTELRENRRLVENDLIHFLPHCCLHHRGYCFMEYKQEGNLIKKTEAFYNNCPGFVYNYKKT